MELNGPARFTAAQAADPRTPGNVLAEIAAQRPDLRPAVASNPATYPDLVTWLSVLGDPAVDSALAARAAAGSSAPGPHAPGPHAPGPHPSGPDPSGSFTPGPHPTGPFTHGPYPSESFTPGPYPSGPYGGAPAPSASSRTVLWVVLGVVVAVAVAVVVIGALAVLRGVGNVMRSIDVPPVTETAPGTGPGAGMADGYGDDPALDALWDRCAAGDGVACDDLYLESPFGSQYEEFGDTCGHREAGGRWCADARG